MFSLKLQNDNSNIVDLNDNEKYVVLAVSGLNPPSASIYTAKSPNRKGVKYNGSTLNERNIIIQVKILGNIEENRNALYEWVDTEQYCKVLYQNGIKNVYCEGHVQDCEIDYFTDNEIIDIAIICENPYWKDLQEISVEISTLLKQFTFPFAIDSQGIPFSTIRENNTTNIFNTGAETGVLIRIRCNADIENLIIFNASNTAERFAFTETLQSGWVVEINTDGSPKTVRVIKPDGTIENYLKKVANNPTWFVLKKGLNKFAYSATSGEAEAEITFGYENKYLGV